MSDDERTLPRPDDANEEDLDADAPTHIEALHAATAPPANLRGRGSSVIAWAW